MQARHKAPPSLMTIISQDIRATQRGVKRKMRRIENSELKAGVGISFLTELTKINGAISIASGWFGCCRSSGANTQYSEGTSIC
jgi:hypothetical protein